MKITISILLLLYVCHTELVAQKESNWKQLDNYLEILEQNKRFMGAVAIYKGEERLYEYYCGFASVDEEKIANYQTRYRIGSITNMYTAGMIHLLISEGKLSMETTLSEYYPQIPNARLITISHLLTHRSGLRNYVAEDDFLFKTEKSWLKGELMNMLVHYPSDFQPGEKAVFSNTNYLLLGFIVDRITETDYATSLRKYITKPYLLTGTKYGGEINTANRDAHSYVFRNRQWEELPQTDLSLVRGTGAVVSTARDLNLFAQALFKKRTISASLFDSLMFVNDGYGSGMIEYTYRDRKSLGHSGSIDGFQSHISFFPDDSVSIAVLSNGINYSLSEIANTGLNICYGYSYVLPSFSGRTTKVPTFILEQLEGNYISELYPQKLSLVLKDSTLYAQTSGHVAYPLTPYENGSFRFDPVGVEIKFEGDNNSIIVDEFVLYQRGGVFSFVKE
ncbi:serine hydrolase [Carboxylicivirga sp. M1479]|uniref:serine hydrolase domain-containing protein n=1 Tax=Carboxylicivirga sp. M1479 TaxID=2594476 RepID=UPI00117868C7|nr:serine hydrolase domain-containing protein [Carboxylicivirga sp. M1479]TRX60300.1 beta-lactamase family protein [Carboxylicivirga sp. M1479]